MAQTIKEICEQYGLKKSDLAKRFSVPYRTVQDWYSGERKPPEYVVTMILELLEANEEKKEG